MFRSLYLKYGKHIPSAALALGFLFDYLTLTRPDRLFENATLAAYLILAAGGLLLFNVFKAKEGAPTYIWILAAVQFAFGSLASSILVLYGRSGTLSGNWLFFLLLGAFLIGNEFARTRYERVRAHLVAFYILLLSYCALIGPVILGRMGGGVFFLSVLASLGLMAFYILILRLVAYRALMGHFRAVGLGMTLVAIVFSAMYFTNLIPPVPLSLREIGIFHAVTKTGPDSYEVVYEAPAWYEFWRSSDTVFHAFGDPKAYCWSAVFAPVGLNTPIYHNFEFYDPGSLRWQSKLRVEFPIVGGRDAGYRGYTVKDGLETGRWRCSVETGDGSVIGRTSFEVVLGEGYPALSSGSR